MVPNELGARLGSPLVSSTAVGWGDAAATYRIELSDGRVLAARRIGGPDPVATARHRAAVMVRLADAGLPVPAPEVSEADGAAWLTSEWVDGETGAAWLDTPDRARQLATSMGQLARRLRAIDAADLGFDDGIATSRGHAEQARAGLAGVETDLRPRTRSAVDEAIRWLGADDRWNPVFVHGDLAPVNVILAPDGAIRALLDVEHAALGSPVADAAWWGWVVRHHHPEAWSASWPSFLEAAGLEAGDDDRPPRHALRATMLVRLLSSVVDASDQATRGRWVARLDEAAAW